MSNTFTETFESYACEGDAITAVSEGFLLEARIVRDGSNESPEERDEGFWPCTNPEAPGFVPMESFVLEMARAERAMKAWKNDEWFYCGIVISISKMVHMEGRPPERITLSDHAASLWGIECNYPEKGNTYLDEVANELASEAIAHGKECLRQILPPSAVVASLADVLNRFKSCLGAGDGMIEGDAEAIAQAEALLNYQPLPALCLTKGKHTPGPWAATIYGGWDQPLITYAKGNIARVHMPESIAEGEANARLIAAALDLLDALKKNNATLHMLWDLVADSSDEEPLRQDVQAQLDINNTAIAKAEGE